MEEQDYIIQNVNFQRNLISEGETIYYFKEGIIFNFIVKRVVYCKNLLIEISCEVPIFSYHFKPYTQFRNETYYFGFGDRKKWDAFFTSELEAQQFCLKYHQQNIEKQKLIISNAKEKLKYSLEIVNKFKN